MESKKVGVTQRKRKQISRPRFLLFIALCIGLSALKSTLGGTVTVTPKPPINGEKTISEESESSSHNKKPLDSKSTTITPAEEVKLSTVEPPQLSTTLPATSTNDSNRTRPPGTILIHPYSLILITDLSLQGNSCAFAVVKKSSFK